MTQGMDHREIEDVMRALRAWFKTQSLAPIDAGFIAAIYSGEIAGNIAKDAKHLERGVDLLCKALKRSSELTLERKS